MGPGQSMLELPVFQGSSLDPRRNTMLGKVLMEDLPPAPAGRHDRPIRVVFRHDLDGLVHIELTDELSGRSVTGEVAADGLQQDALWADFLASNEEQGLGFMVDERSAPGASSGGVALPAATVLPPGAEEASACFQQLLSSEARLGREHPEVAEELLGLARNGEVALTAGRVADGLAAYDTLSDRLFELGIYL